MALDSKITDDLSMPQSNQNTGKLPIEKNEKKPISQDLSQNNQELGKDEPKWPGKAGNNCAFPEDVHGRWYPTGWGAGCGPDLSPGAPRITTPQSSKKATLKVKAPSFEIGSVCPNCGFAKLSLDADEYVSCPLCRFGGICESCG